MFMRIKALPELNYLNTCFEVDFEEGTLVWKARPLEHFSSVRGWKTWNSKYAHKDAGHIFRDYKVVKLDYSRYHIHRVLWKFYTGKDTSLLIDHINGDTLDNRRINLREATASQNSCNSKRPKNNTSGFKGVSFAEDRGKYRAQISLHRKTYMLGGFDTPEEAYAVYCAAASKIQGAFANIGVKSDEN
jgi:hypothetical protein